MREITEKSYAAALDKVIELVEKRKPDLNVRHLVIVPDNYTFTLEKCLFLKNKGSFDVEVTTFNRLCLRLSGAEKALSKQGAIMLLKKICLENADKLACYSKSCLRPGFSVKLYDAINALRASDIGPDALENAGSLHKSADLALLYRAYLEVTRGRYVDAAGRMEILREATEKRGALKDCHVYVALYEDYTAQLKKLLDAVDKHALSLTVIDAAPPADYRVSAPVRAVACPDKASEYKEAAKRIRYYAYSGGRYGDVCVVDESGDFNTAKRIFDEYEIPYYAQTKIPLSGTELFRFLFTALDAANKKYRTRDMISLAANYYSGISKRDSDAFTDFVHKRCVDYLGFTETFVSDDDKDEDAVIAEKVRIRLMRILRLVETEFSSAAALSSASEKLLDFVGAAEKTRELSLSDGRNLDAVFAKTQEIIRLFGEIYADRDIPSDDLADILREGFEGTEISLVPNLSDTVQIGSLSRFRGQRPRFAVIVGFNDGALPALCDDDGLLSDADADKLEDYKLKLEPKSARKNELCRYELWHFLKASEKIFITYSLSDGNKPSFDFQLLSSRNDVRVSDHENFIQELCLKQNPDTVAAMLGSAKGALETLLVNEKLPFASSVAAALDDDYRKFLNREERADYLSSGKALMLKSRVTSVSALQTYYLCPYMYFMNYGLRIKKAEDGTVTPIDVGLLLHKVVELFVNEGMPSDIAAFVPSAVEKAVSEFEKYRYRVNERILSRVRKEAETLCAVVKSQIDAGEFKPYSTEESFGKEDSVLKTLTLSGDVRLSGEIDRIDVFGDYARVIDYKTGQTHFSYSDLYFGKKIQLMIYMRVLEENGFKPAGFFYFPFSVSWSDDEFSHRLSGAFDSSGELLKAFDRGLIQPYKSRVVDANLKLNKDGDLVLTKNNRACTQQQLYMLTEYAEKAADNAVNEILSGFIAALPAESGKKTACSFCDYAAICKGPRRVRKCDGATKEDVLGAVQEL